MNGAIKTSCKYTDIISSTVTGSFARRHDVDPATAYEELRSSALMSEVSRASVAAGFALLPIQTKAVSRIVYRPSSTVYLSPVSFDSSPSTYRTPKSDVMSPVILDMPTGTGKTITSLVGAIVFAIERREDMKKKSVVPPAAAGVVNVSGCVGWDPLSVLPDTSKCIVFTPRHLVQHWINHGQIAKNIVEAMTFRDGSKWTVRVEANKFASRISVGPNEVLVVICDSSRCGVKKFLEPTIHYSAVCFDEAGESDSKVNALCQMMVQNISHGRMILVSADFSKWRYCFDPRANSIFRHIFPLWSRYSMTETAAATCATAAVFSRSERSTVMNECTAALDSAILDIARVGYRPSLVERVGGGYGTELGEDRGCDLFFRKYDVNVSRCSTVDDIVAAIEGVIEENNRLAGVPGLARSDVTKLCDKINELHGVQNKIRGVLSEDCPVCLERVADLTLIQPCLHFTCSTCARRLTGSCPMCRGQMQGTVAVAAEERRVKKARVAPPTTEERIGGLFFDDLAALCGPSAPIGVMQAIEHTLKAVQNARARSPRAGKTLRTMIICPGSNMRDGLFANMGFDVTHYRTSGTRGDPVTMRKMNTAMDKFRANDGTSKLLCVRDAGHGCKQDSMTGLDIPNLDCVISIGGLNLAQRMGRLCRLSRMGLPEDEKHALYVDIVPIYD